MLNEFTSEVSLFLSILLFGCTGGGNKIANLQESISDSASHEGETLASTRGPETEDSTVDAEGWTILTPSADSRLIYVSSSTGNDANDGLAPARAKATIPAGQALLREGYPDWILLKRNDIFDTSASGLGWARSGRSSLEPTVMTSYGEGLDRPRIHSGLWSGLSALNNPSMTPIQHVAIVGLHFFASGYDGSNGEPKGLSWHADFDDLLIEDCRFEKYFGGAVVEVLDGPRGHDLRMRRCQILDAYTTSSGHSGGLYINAVDGILLKENLFDHNGWSETVPGAGATIFRHNAYIQSGNTGLRAVDNIFASGGSHGLQARPGGLVKNNLFVNNALALLLGTTWATVAPVTFEASDNVILTGRDISPTLPRGWGIEMDTAEGGLLKGNLIANQGTAGFPVPLSFCNPDSPTGLHNVIIEDNTIYNWGGHMIMQGVPPLLTNIVFRRNVLSERDVNGPLIRHLTPASPSFFHSSENRFWTRPTPLDSWFRTGDIFLSTQQWAAGLGDTTSRQARPNFREPSRDLGGYQAHLGGPNSFQAFLNHARGMSKGRWDGRYTAAAANDWIRAGFAPAN